MNVQYETLMLTRTESTADELHAIENHLNKLVTGANGALSTFDKWGKCQLAYPVKNNSYGVYVLARYELPKNAITSTLKDLESFLRIKCNELVLRHVTVQLNPKTAGSYQKPELMGTGKTSSLDTFLKESKIEQFLDSVDSSTKGDHDDSWDDNGHSDK